MSKDPKPKWKKGDTIRHLKNHTPYLVVHVYSGIATMIVNLLDDGSNPKILLPKCYDEYASDIHLLSHQKEFLWS